MDPWRNRSGWLAYPIAVLLLHLAGITGLYLAAAQHPSFWGLGVVAYTLGLRHAFDVDHIAAIDNTVRKLVQQQRNPLGVGFYFSLGHSTVVFLMAIATAFSVRWIESEAPRFKEWGGVIGASVSGLFLLGIGLINLVILVNLYRLFRDYRAGAVSNIQFERLLASRGFFSRLIAPLNRFIGRSWHVYPLGFLFGLGFDTASEIALLAISADAASAHIPVFGMLSLPILFAAGMSLLDTADGMFMTAAYRWAFVTPLRKLIYNLTVTALAVAAALLIGSIEVLQVMSSKMGFKGSFWSWVQAQDFASLGFLIAGLFVLAWAVSFGVWKILRPKPPGNANFM